ncbi:methyl-accepting chemotaxis protein [Natranaerovirga pectinivora]|uniref:Methyl-accepting chemotaxis protein n=1 Tax=Natranaerovirga pectinivora TaxID=682400 RepID=A0A4V2V072_9FIRM|nr:methyl-accepting chemotaxis protein [Natranaerovirga pectinivora]TCT14308.1 methyl-accepting chemotaxis protein [Natranaerovirga pectinivora]
MKSIKLKLIAITNFILVGSIIAISIVAIITLGTGMSDVLDHLYENTLSTKMNAYSRILNYEYGPLQLRNGNFINESGQEIIISQDFISEVGKDLGITATVFIRENDDFKRVASNVKDQEGNVAINTYLGKDHPAYSLIKGGDSYLGQANLFGTSYYTIYQPIFHNNEVIGIQYLGLSTEEAIATIASTAANNENKLIQTAIMVVLIGILIMYLYSRKISNQIIELSKFGKKLAQGDLTEELIINEKEKDELAQLKNAFLQIKNNLRSMINEIQESAVSVSNFTGTIKDIMSQTSLSTDEVAKTMEQITSSIQEQAKDTQDASQSVIELGESIADSGKKMSKLQRVSEAIRKRTKNGNEIVETLSEKTDANEGAINTIVETIEMTKVSSEKISEVTKVINSIANQTNLLALNAAIEAARAGENGRGFAVVANEIRILAEQSTKSTKEIDNMVSELQKNVATSVETINNVKALLLSQVSSVKDTKVIYTKINNAISAALTLIVELNDSSLKMEGSRIRITEIVQNLTAIAEENAAGTEETSASIEELSATMSEISKSSEDLLGLANKLEKSTKNFTT